MKERNQCNNSIVDIDRWKRKVFSKLYAHQIQSIAEIILDDGVFSLS